MIFCDSNASPDSPEKAKARLELADSINALQIPAFVDKMLPGLLAPNAERLNPGVVATLREIMTSQSPEAIAAASRGMAKRSDSAETLATLHAPTLVLGGEFDALSTPKQLDAIADAIPNASRATIPNAGHLPPIENPDAFVDAVLTWCDANSL